MSKADASGEPADDPAAPPPEPPHSDVDDALDLAAKHASESAREWLDAIKGSFETALDKKYDAELFAKDVAAFWARTVRDGARVATDVALVARALAAHVPEPAPDPTSAGEAGGSPT
jgi:hypothetical protein